MLLVPLKGLYFSYARQLLSYFSLSGIFGCLAQINQRNTSYVRKKKIEIEQIENLRF